MKAWIATALLLPPCFLGPSEAQEPAVPEELQSPNTGSGDLEGFLETVASRAGREPRAVRAAVVILATLPETRSYLGTPLAEAVRGEMRRLLLDDLDLATWADLA